MANQISAKEGSLFTYRYLVAVNFITMGTELCASAAFGYLPPLLLEAGFSESGMSTVMAAGPFLALFLLPVMGTASDQCQSRYGRRRPFIFVLSLGIIISLLLIPNVRSVVDVIPGHLSRNETGLLLLALGTIVLDFCSQVCYTPIESLISDPCKTELQRNRSFGIFSVMMSSGACLGYWVVSVNWGETAISDYFGGQQKTVFGILLVFFTATLVISILIAHDPPLMAIHDENVDRQIPLTIKSHNHNQNPTLPVHSAVQPTHIVPPNASIPQKRPIQPPLITLTPKFKLSCKSLLALIPVPKVGIDPIIDTINGIRTMPKAMQTLWLAHLVTCTAVMGFRLYFTDYVGGSIFHGNPDSPLESLSRKAYENGVRMGSFGLLLHSLLSAVFSMLMGAVIMKCGSVTAYLFGMGMFTLATLIMLFVSNVEVTLVLATLTGFANATITIVPYIVLTGYHQKKEQYFQESSTPDSNLHGKGADLALLDSAYILSEVISSFAFGVIVDLTKTNVAYIVCSFVCGLISCFLVLQIKK